MWRKPPRGAVREQLDRRRLSEADLEPAHVVGPGPGYGQWTVHDTLNGQERVVAAPFGNPSFKPGTSVMLGSYTGQGNRAIAVAAPPGRGGTAQFSFPSATGSERHAYNLVTADPDTLAVGSVDVPVDFTGFGLRASDTYRAVKYNPNTKEWDDDPYYTLGAATWTSATEVSMPVSLSSSAPAGYELRIEVVR